MLSLRTTVIFTNWVYYSLQFNDFDFWGTIVAFFLNSRDNLQHKRNIKSCDSSADSAASISQLRVYLRVSMQPWMSTCATQGHNMTSARNMSPTFTRFPTGFRSQAAEWPSQNHSRTPDDRSPSPWTFPSSAFPPGSYFLVFRHMNAVITSFLSSNIEALRDEEIIKKK